MQGTDIGNLRCLVLYTRRGRPGQRRCLLLSIRFPVFVYAPLCFGERCNPSHTKHVSCVCSRPLGGKRANNSDHSVTWNGKDTLAAEGGYGLYEIIDNVSPVSWFRPRSRFRIAVRFASSLGILPARCHPQSTKSNDVDANVI